MRKVDSLRRWLTACLPDDFRDHLDRLQIFVDSGSIASTRSRTLSFVYRYTAKVFVADFAGDADRLMVPLLAWIQKEQRHLLRKQDGEAFSFEAELLDSETSDIESLSTSQKTAWSQPAPTAPATTSSVRPSPASSMPSLT